LVLQYHTGVAMAANSSYNGITFYDDYNNSTVRFRINGGSGYTYKYTWMNTNTTGFYSSTNNWHIEPNTLTSYGSMNLRGSRNGYYGISMHEAGNDPHIMFDGGGNGGFYLQTGGRWPIYYHYSNNCVGVCGSSTSSTYELYVTGDIYASGNINSASDARLKDNVSTIENALDKVMGLRGVTFTWNNLKEDDEDYGKTQMGFIAQEVEPVVPEVVTYAEDNDQYGLNYGQMTALLTEAMKQQQKTINMLKEEIENLKSKLGE
jgi:hypothetical protein